MVNEAIIYARDDNVNNFIEIKLPCMLYCGFYQFNKHKLTCLVIACTFKMFLANIKIL